MKLQKIRITLTWFSLAALFLSLSPAEAQRLQSPESFCPECNCPPPPQCPRSQCPDTPTRSICPTIPPQIYNCGSDPTLKNYVQSSIPQCLTCSQALIDFAAICNPGGCTKKCDASKGEYLWEPTCECLSQKVTCDKLFAAETAGGEGVALVNTNWLHPTTQGIYQYQIGTFQHVTSAGSVNDFGTAQNLALHSACLSKIRKNCVAMNVEGISWTDGLTSARFGDEADQCMFAALNSASRQIDFSNQGTPTETTGVGYTMDGRNRAVTVNIEKWTGSGYLNTDCTPAEPWKVDLINNLKCPIREYNFNVITSPISLLWAEGLDISSITARSKFPLNPELTGKWFEWKASGYTPLVVWDPEGTGMIAEAHQLFGNFTWKKSWKNGYEALATMDKNANGWLEGKELQGIALWFDFDQDGVSDKGEVKTLASVAVDAIGVKPNEGEKIEVKADGGDQGGRNIFADKGFKRTKNGKVKVGRSVDWFVGYTDGRLGIEALSTSAVVPVPGEVLAEISREQSIAHEFSGFWDWKVVSDDDFPQNLPGGMLRIKQQGAVIEGYTMSQGNLTPNGSGVGFKVTKKGFKGDTHAENGGRYMRFETVGTGDSPVYAIANLSADGQLLKGLSKEKLPNGKWVEYSWIAKRYQ